MAKITKVTMGAVRSAVGGTKVPLHGNPRSNMTKGAVRSAVGGAKVPVSSDKVGRTTTSPATKMSQPPNTTGRTV